MTHHVGIKTVSSDGVITSSNEDASSEYVISKEVSDNMREILEQVVYIGTGNKTYLSSYKVGGKQQHHKNYSVV